MRASSSAVDTKGPKCCRSGGGRRRGWLRRDSRRYPVNGFRMPRRFDLLAGRYRLYFSGLQGVGTWRSLVAHLLWEQRAAGSNPAVPTMFLLDSEGRPFTMSGGGRPDAARQPVEPVMARQPTNNRCTGTTTVAKMGAYLPDAVPSAFPAGTIPSPGRHPDPHGGAVCNPSPPLGHGDPASRAYEQRGPVSTDVGWASVSRYLSPGSAC
jgi:hypothetical protein